MLTPAPRRTSPSVLWVLVPVAAQGCAELSGPLVREEQACPFEFDYFGNTRDGVAQPVSPLALEERVAGAPDNKSWHVQTRQSRLGR